MDLILSFRLSERNEKEALARFSSDQDFFKIRAKAVFILVIEFITFNALYTTSFLAAVSPISCLTLF